MQQCCNHSKSYSKNVLSWAYFADASGGKEPERCSCTSEGTVSITLPEINMLCIFYEEHKQMNPSVFEIVTGVLFGLTKFEGIQQ